MAVPQKPAMNKSKKTGVLFHREFPKLVQYNRARNVEGLRMPIILTGPAGSAKSKGAEQLADKLGMRFGYIAGSQQLTKSDMLGYKSPNGDVIDSLLGDFYQNGGVFVLEEMDAINGNILLNINTAIVSNNGYFAGRMVKRHKDFILIATANTYGGSTEDYNARTKLDESTMSRFLRIEWLLDEILETGLLKDELLDKSIKLTRSAMREAGYTLSMRDVLSYKSLLEIGVEYIDASYSTVLRAVDDNRRAEFVSGLLIQRPSKDEIVMDV